MSELTQKTLETIKKYLLRQQKEVEENLQAVTQDDPATENALAESSEPGTDSWIAEEHSSSVAIGNSLQTTASGVKKALLKLKNGGYGKCEKCTKQIEIGRLLAMPTAIFCVTCSKNH